MDQSTPPELLAHAPKQNSQHETDVVDQAGHRIVALLREAADISAEKVERALWRSCIAVAIHSRAMLRSWSRIS